MRSPPCCATITRAGPMSCGAATSLSNEGKMTLRKAYGGKTVYGARVGILMLETKWPRMPGDTGNALTWPFPVLYKVVRGATARVVIHERGRGLGQGFLDAAAELMRKHPDVGAVVLECNNMAPFSRMLANAFGIPVYDVYTLVTWFHAGLSPRDFGPPAAGNPAPRGWRER